MRILIDSLDIPYNHMNRNYESLEGEDNENLIDCISLNYNYALLPFPLKDVGINFRRFGDKYSVNSLLESFDGSSFFGISINFKKRIKSIGYNFIPQKTGSNNCSGYIFDKNDDCKFCIAEWGENVKIIGMGSWGTEPYYFPESDEKFFSEVKILEGIVNIFIDCVLEPYSKNHNLKFLKDKVLYLNP